MMTKMVEIKRKQYANAVPRDKKSCSCAYNAERHATAANTQVTVKIAYIICTNTFIAYHT